MSEERTEQPTESRLREARKEGNVSKSSDLTDAVSMLAGVCVLSVGSASFAAACRAIIAGTFDFVAGPRDVPSLFDKLYSFGIQAALIVLPCITLALLATAATLTLQVGFQISSKAAVPDLTRVNPISGFARIFTWATVIELAKMVVKTAIVGLVMGLTIRHMMPIIADSLYQPLPELSKMFWVLGLRLCTSSLIVFLIIGIADVKLQRILFIRRMKMTKNEVKRERMQQEGNPRIKGERRRLRRELVDSATPRQRVGLANALLVNPTHYAVAIRYAPDEYPLPLVTAKGMDEAAAQLRTFAMEAGVPVITNPPLTRALYKVDIDEAVPREFLETIAAILRWVNAIGAKNS